MHVKEEPRTINEIILNETQRIWRCFLDPIDKTQLCYTERDKQKYYFHNVIKFNVVFFCSQYQKYCHCITSERLTKLVSVVLSINFRVLYIGNGKKLHVYEPSQRKFGKPLKGTNAHEDAKSPFKGILELNFDRYRESGSSLHFSAFSSKDSLQTVPSCIPTLCNVT